MSVSLRLVSIDSLKKGRDSGATPASQSEHLCRTNVNLSDKGTARCFLAKTKIRGERFFVRTLKSLRYGLQGRVCSRCNITTVRAPKQALRADWSGRERTSEARYLVGCILHHEQNLSLSKDETQYSKPSFLHSFYKSFMESI